LCILSLLPKRNSVFSSIVILSWSPEILSSTYHSRLEWPSIVIFIWFKELFISGVCAWLFLLSFSLSLFNSYFIFCVVFFISYLSFFIVSFVSLQYLLKSSLTSFSCFCFFSSFLFVVCLYSLNSFCKFCFMVYCSFSISISMSLCMIFSWEIVLWTLLSSLVIFIILLEFRTGF
jgi:hypothetical protein